MKNMSLYLALLVAILLSGCAHEQFITDAKHPEVAVDYSGNVTYRGQIVDPEDLPDLLKDSGLTREDTIHIHIISGLRDYRKPYYVLGILVKNGFTRSVFVEDRQSFSEVSSGKRKKTGTEGANDANSGKKVRIRYKN